ncbi:hypothetical protein [Micromonospora sp. WMMD1082]|uniref:hypothetical protein n=1 Tax=Micromonospora sp. WMMD1082 TaxID=3016104 RepID=UPI0024160BD5|nr:hypothetical protein [Micromonospora sp. WMMD1082]MDG4795758.1 hypothetical protein [Micromonospora sp. WMMD1082]
MRVSRAWLLACLVLPFLAACVIAPTESVAPPSVTYTCCTDEDVNTPYEPGQTLTVHWIVEHSPEPGGVPPQVELTAHLTGPYATVEALKSAIVAARDIPGVVTFAAAPVRPAGTPDEQPVSPITIPGEAQPGYYNLTTSVVDGDHTASGSSIVQVVSRG